MSEPVPSRRAGGSPRGSPVVRRRHADARAGSRVSLAVAHAHPDRRRVSTFPRGLPTRMDARTKPPTAGHLHEMMASGAPHDACQDEMDSVDGTRRTGAPRCPMPAFGPR
ncbi:hypothetical protein QJS66_10485 [Kocuria rhizophila]|nr:hypothetical protein QJS66_10485 [Kocuria rhizophila]